MASPLDDKAMNQLQSQQAELLGKLDELRAIGLGRSVELPQIIVCGNRSSGKSSVLEAISRVRFPSQSNICTRFATEVILRRSPHNKIKASIEPGDSRKDDVERQKLRNFTSESFSSGEDLPTLIESAKECMGLSSTDFSNTEFSDDILKVEISGPKQPDLILVDLPGLYDDSSSKEQNVPGMKIVQALTAKYMENPRSIILAVTSASADCHIPKILDIAQTFDPKYENPGYFKLQLGWHVLRNRSFETRKISDDTRDLQEKEFFEKGAWASISRDQIGIESLRSRLSKILLDHTRRNLPGLIADIEEIIFRNEQALAQLGAPRTSLQEQRHFLVDISGNFARITDQALNGSYVDEFFGGFSDHTASAEEYPFRRLRALIRELNEYFTEAMSIRGSRRIILFPGQSALPVDFEQERSKPYMEDWTPQYISQESLELEIQNQARESRGLELPGSANQLIVGSLFRDQCAPWEALAKSHLMNTWDSVEYFIQLVLQYLTDDQTRPLLMRHLIRPEMEKIKDCLLEKLSELTLHFKRGHPLPVGKSFLSKIQESRKSREVSASNALRNNVDSSGLFSAEAHDQTAFDCSNLNQAVSRLHLSSNQIAAAEIIDQMQAYYDTAIVTFVDNISILAIENCLLCPLEHIFTGKTVLGMSDQQIREIAAEPLHVQKDRQRLNEELEILQKGKQALRSFSTEDSSLRPPRIFGASNFSRTQTPSLAGKTKDSQPTVAPGTPAKQSNQSSLPIGVAQTAQMASNTPPASLQSQTSTFFTGPIVPPSPKGIFGSSQNRPLFPTSTGDKEAKIEAAKAFLSKSASGSVFGGTGPYGGAPGGPGTKSQGFGASNTSTSEPIATKNKKPNFDATKYPETTGSLKGHIETDDISGAVNYYQSICSIPLYARYSPEELRLGDYTRRNSGRRHKRVHLDT